MKNIFKKITQNPVKVFSGILILMSLLNFMNDKFWFFLVAAAVIDILNDIKHNNKP